jgi:FKBP-type peptidyl-prolyl cis-trans isomerase FkpA
MINKFFKTVLLLMIAGSFLLLVSCDPAKKYEKTERESIDNYLNTNSTKDFQQKPSGMYYLEVLAGTGPAPVTHDTVYVIYTGKYLNGNVFDSNVGASKLIFPCGEGYMIAGFEEGITYMNEGGKATFLLPSKLAYGTHGFYNIAGYTPLLYDVELVKVVHVAKK